MLTRVADLLPLPVPRPVFRDPDGGLPYSVHEEVIGDPLTEERWLGMLPREKNRVAAELGGFLTALHSLPIEAVRQCGVRSLGQAQLARRLRSTAPETIYRLLDPESRQRLGDLLERCSTTDARDLVPALVHGDVAPGHVLFDPVHNQLTGIIDFGDLVLADPARDFIYIYEDFGQEFLAVVLSFYRREASATLLPRIRDWYLLEAVSWTVQMCEEQHRAKTGQGIREIVRELATE